MGDSILINDQICFTITLSLSHIMADVLRLKHCRNLIQL